MRFGRLAHAALLTVVCLPALAVAQPRPGGAPPPIGSARPGAGGVEVGAGSMVVAIFPTIGGQVSIPASRRVRLEVGTHLLPWMLEDGDDVGVVTQVQVRIPFRDGPPGSRRSLLVGGTAFTISDRWDSVGEWHFDTAVRPHAGVSWQWQQSRYLDLRLDLQGVFTGASLPFVVPFATFSVVWHGERRWS
jgi:hypothetical protein